MQTDCIVNPWAVKGHIDGEGGGIVVGAKTSLAFSVVPDNKVHDCMSLKGRVNWSGKGLYC